MNFYFLLCYRRPGFLMHFGDFANILKAFIGANYLGIAYAFKRSGLVVS